MCVFSKEKSNYWHENCGGEGAGGCQKGTCTPILRINAVYKIGSWYFADRLYKYNRDVHITLILLEVYTNDMFKKLLTFLFYTFVNEKLLDTFIILTRKYKYRVYIALDLRNFLFNIFYGFRKKSSDVLILIYKKTTKIKVDNQSYARKK